MLQILSENSRSENCISSSWKMEKCIVRFKKCKKMCDAESTLAKLIFKKVALSFWCVCETCRSYLRSVCVWLIKTHPRFLFNFHQQCVIWWFTFSCHTRSTRKTEYGTQMMKLRIQHKDIEPLSKTISPIVSENWWQFGRLKKMMLLYTIFQVWNSQCSLCFVLCLFFMSSAQNTKPRTRKS